MFAGVGAVVDRHELSLSQLRRAHQKIVGEPHVMHGRRLRPNLAAQRLAHRESLILGVNQNHHVRVNGPNLRGNKQEGQQETGVCFQSGAGNEGWIHNSHNGFWQNMGQEMLANRWHCTNLKKICIMEYAFIYQFLNHGAASRKKFGVFVWETFV